MWEAWGSTYQSLVPGCTSLLCCNFFAVFRSWLGVKVVRDCACSVTALSPLGVNSIEACRTHVLVTTRMRIAAERSLEGTRGGQDVGSTLHRFACIAKAMRVLRAGHNGSFPDASLAARTAASSLQILLADRSILRSRWPSAAAHSRLSALTRLSARPHREDASECGGWKCGTRPHSRNVPLGPPRSRCKVEIILVVRLGLPALRPLRTASGCSVRLLALLSSCFWLSICRGYIRVARSSSCRSCHCLLALLLGLLHQLVEAAILCQEYRGLICELDTACQLGYEAAASQWMQHVRSRRAGPTIAPC